MTSSEQSLTLSVLGMSCGHCKATLEHVLHNLPGVHEVNVDLKGKRVTIRGSELDQARLRRLIDQAGYVVKN